MTEKVFGDRAAILGAADLPTEDVFIPEWGTWVRVRSLMAIERDAFEESCFVGAINGRRGNFANIRARLVALVVVDEAGKRVFSEADVEALGQKSAGALDRIFTVAQRLSGLGERDVQALLGNSGSGPRDGTTSGSPAGSA
jgi:hypothetical protein